MYYKENDSIREISHLSWEVRAALTISLLALLLQACAPATKAVELPATLPEITATSLPTDPIPTLTSPTSRPDFVPGTIPTPPIESVPLTQAPEYLIGQETRLNLAQPFTLTIPFETAKKMGRGAELAYHADLPLPQSDNYWNQADVTLFNENGDDNSAGNAFMLVPTDNPKHFIIISHSGVRSAPSELVIKAGDLESAGRAQDYYGGEALFTFGSTQVMATIVDTRTIPTAQFFEPTNWTELDSDAFQAELDKFGLDNLPEASADTYYLTLVGCQYETPGRPNFKEVLEGASVNQTLVTFRLTLP